MKSKKISIPVKSIPALPLDDARWLAVEAIVCSVAIKQDFEPLFYGQVAEKIINWNKRNMDALSPDELDLSIKLAAVFQDHTPVSKHALKQFQYPLLNEVIPLGMCIERVLMGTPQGEVFDEVSKLFLRYSKTTLEERAGRPVKSIRHLSTSKLEKLWAKYAQVLPYVRLLYLKTLADTGTGQQPSGLSIELAVPEFLAKLGRYKRTKPIRIKSPVELIFVQPSSQKENPHP